MSDAKPAESSRHPRPRDFMVDLASREWLELGKIYNKRALDWRVEQSWEIKTRFHGQIVGFLSWFTVSSPRRKYFLEQVAKFCRQ